jgi:protein TonB
MSKPQLLAVLACAGLAVLAGAQTEPVKQPSRLKVSSGVAEGLKTHSVNPKYPREARDKGTQGDVILQATIDTKGNVTNLNAVKGDPILADASIEAVKQWKYRPYMLNGEPVEVETTIKIQFHM